MINSRKHSRYKDGRTLKINYCVDCKTIIKWNSIRCRLCAAIDRCKNSSRYRNGISVNPHFCIKCNKKLGNYIALRCKSCEGKRRKGELAGGYIDGRSLKQNFCLDCKIGIEWNAKRCLKCDRKFRWSKLEYKNKVIKKVLQALKIKPNKPEKFLDQLLNKLFPKKYKFVGDGKVILDGFNPDFINTNGQKKIIELYGDYWHNLPKAKKRDKRRLKAYKKFGYKTLIVWECELKYAKKLVKKLEGFC